MIQWARSCRILTRTTIARCCASATDVNHASTVIGVARWIDRLVGKAFTGRHLILTNMTICLTLSGLGDILQQRSRYLFDRSEGNTLINGMKSSNSGANGDGDRRQKSDVSSAEGKTLINGMESSNVGANGDGDRRQKSDVSLEYKPRANGRKADVSDYGHHVQHGSDLDAQKDKSSRHSASDVYTHDWQRTRNVVISAFPMGLVVHYWYIWMDSRFTGRSLRTLCLKTGLDQLVFSPVMWAVYLSCLCLLEARQDKQKSDVSAHESRSDGQKSDVSDYGIQVRHSTVLENAVSAGTQLYLTEWLVWPPAQFLNFYFLPTKYRVLYDNFISLGFDWYSSYLIFDKKGPS